MVAVPLPLSSAPGRNQQESAGRLINCYAEPLGQTARAPASYRRVPGLSTFATSDQSGFRGMQDIAGTLFAGIGTQVLSTGPFGGEMTPIGILPGEKPLFWARNNAAPTPDVVAVDPDNGAFEVSDSGVVTYSDPNLGQPNSVFFLGGYFFFTYGSGLMRASGLNSTSINTEDFATAETKSDGLLRGVPWNNQAFFFGQFSTEVWTGQPANPTGFPFSLVTAIPRGLGGRYAVAGHESGFGRALLWVGDDFRVHMLTGGYAPDDVSPPDLDRLIASVSDPDTLEATVYVADGVPRWVLSSPDWTWEFNLNSMKWNERKSYLAQRWRGTQAFFSNGIWLIGDVSSGNILKIDHAIKNEAGNPLRATIESGSAAKFPNRVPVMRIDVDVTVGVGVVTGNDPTQTDPTLELSMSRNGGVDWDAPRLLPLGRQAVADQRVFDTRFGLAGPQGPRVRLEISDEVDFGIMGVDISAGLRPK